MAAIVESSDDAIVSKTLDGIVTSWNRGAEGIFGYTAEEMVGQPINRIIPPDRQDEEPRILAQLRRGERIEHFETVRIRKDGSPLFVSVTLSPIRDTSGRVVGISKIARDISDRKQKDWALIDAASRFRAIVETAVDAIITIDEQGRVQSVNSAAERLFGYRTDEMLGRNVKMLMSSPDRERHDQYLHNYLATGVRRIIGIGREVVGQRRDGTMFPMDLAISEVRLADGRRLFAGIVHDISQRKTVETELRSAKDAAEAANRSKDHLLAMVSHELRTPLTPALALVSVLLRSPNLGQEMREDLDTIRSSIEREARLVDDLLNLTRLSRGKVELERETLDLHVLTRTAAAQFEDRFDAAEIEFSMALRAKSHHVRADGGRLRQVLDNLLDNALKFTPRGGRIAIRSSSQPTGGTIRVEIVDSGIGIEAEALPRIFGAFEQADKAVTRKYGGLGLGLAICRQIVALHGGRLSASSEGRDRGTTLVLELPTITVAEETYLPRASNALAADTPPAATNAAPQKHCTILLVEDHPDTLRVMAKLLSGAGHHVVTAANAHEALQLAETEEFDLLISDIGLPDGSGLDVMRELRRRHPIPGIAVSGFGQPEDFRKSKEAGFAEHVTKPINLQTLETMIRRYA